MFGMLRQCEHDNSLQILRHNYTSGQLSKECLAIVVLERSSMALKEKLPMPKCIGEPIGSHCHHNLHNRLSIGCVRAALKGTSDNFRNCKRLLSKALNSHLRSLIIQLVIDLRLLHYLISLCV